MAVRVTSPLRQSSQDLALYRLVFMVGRTWWLLVASLECVTLWPGNHVLAFVAQRQSAAFERPWQQQHQGGHTGADYAPTTTTAFTGLFLSHDEEEETVELTDGKTISKAKWKKKRFLMLRDVNAALQKENPRAAHKAQEVVRRMWQLYELTTDEDFQPDLQVYNLWIHALAKSKARDCGQQAEEIIVDMKQRGVAPNVVSYTNVMDAYANQARFGDSQAPEHAERVLFDLIAQSEMDHSLMVTPVTADVAMNAWAQQGTWDGAVRAQQILDRMEGMAATSLRPTVHSYATVIHGWAQSKGGTEAAKRAERVLNGLLHGDKGVDPDTVVFNAVIDAWSMSKDPRAGSKALALLNKMKELCKTKEHSCEPDVVTYNTVLSAWSHSGHINAASKTEQILQSMLEAHRKRPDSCPAPNTVSYNCVLHAWSRSSLETAVSRVETILQFMIRSDDLSIAPDTYSFTNVLNTLGKSKQSNKAERARNCLEMMLQMHTETKRKSLKPTQVPFNAVLNAAAFSALGTPEQEQRTALKVAVETFSLMKKLSLQPDTISYGNMLKVVANLVPRGNTRTEMALQLLKGCCQDGLVGDLAWNEARRALPPKILSDLLRTQKPLSTIRVKDLPRSWTKNLPRARRMHFTPKQKMDPKPDPVEMKRREPIRRFRNINEQSYQSGRDV